MVRHIRSTLRCTFLYTNPLGCRKPFLAVLCAYLNNISYSSSLCWIKPQLDSFFDSCAHEGNPTKPALRGSLLYSCLLHRCTPPPLQQHARWIQSAQCCSNPLPPINAQPMHFITPEADRFRQEGMDYRGKSACVRVRVRVRVRVCVWAVSTWRVS